jgi:methionyl aminopeptidase
MIRIKSKKQIKEIRKSCRLAAATLDYLSQFVRCGITTLELDELAEKFIRDHGGTPACLGYRVPDNSVIGYMEYPKTLCTSVNEVVCHGVPNAETVLKEGDILNIDVATCLNGYYGDTCRMFTIGKVPANAQRLLGVAKKALDLAIEAVRPGAYYSVVGHIISDYVEANGYSVVKGFCGHGVGLGLHEEPSVAHYRSKNVDRMRPGHIFTIEPMVNEGTWEHKVDEDKWTARTADLKLSAQYEHTVLVTPSGCEILTVSEETVAGGAA